ncbi:glycosyltransferase [Lysinibacillus xylanilyticus]|uniref:glycosyltransferase n=1 Tax=Lysinibacillus xylanilyticus TaxID=582475 RepID=UPI0037F4C185
MIFTGERFIPTVEDIDDEIKIEHLQRYQSVIPLLKNKVVLDAACGEGYGSEILSAQARQVYGMDIDEKSITHAKKTYVKSNLDFLVGSIEKLPFEDDFFDIIVSFETIEHVDENLQKKFLKEIKRVLKKDGLLIISTPNKKVYSDHRNYSNPFHIKEFYKDEFYTFLKSSFQNVEFYYQLRESVFLLSKNNSQFFYNLDTKIEVDEMSKYIVAICSEVVNPDIDFSSVIIEDGNFNKKMERIIELQNEVEERNRHLETLDKKIEEYKGQIALLNQTIEEKNDNNSLLVEELNRNQEMYTELLQENKIIKETKEVLRQEIGNLKMENESLKEKERLLNNIFDSDGWKLLLKYYRVRDKILSPDGKLRFFLKIFKKIIVDRNFKMLNKENFKKFFYYYKNQNLSMLENRVDNYIERHTSNSQSFQISIEQPTQNYEKIIFEKFEKPKVSIIIPVYNQWNYTYACMKSIYLQTQNIPYEVIIADDMSNDETVNIEEYVENVKTIRDGENRGFLLNCNNAAKYADGDYIFFLNNDTQVQEGWLDSLVRLIESDQQIGMVGSKLVYPDGRLQEAGGIIWNDASGWNYGRLDDPTKPEYNYVKEVDYISGAAIMIRKSLWQTIGGFDERYVPAYYEDTDLAFEVRKHGYKVLLQPKSIIVHFEGISHGTDENSNSKMYQKKNKEIFLGKWKDELNNFHSPNGVNAFLARDRSINKKTIVVVDHYVPHYDKDAGGRCTYLYLNLFNSLGYKVIFIGDNFYKHEPYTSSLQEKGIEVLYGDEYAKNIEQWFKDNNEHINYVYLNRPHISIKYIDKIKKYTSAKVIYFGHDLHYLRELRNYEIEKNPDLIKSSNKWREIEFGLFNKADVVHVVGSYEQKILVEEFPNKPIRNIPLFMFEQDEIKQVELNFDSRKDILFVGGFNHKPNYDGVLWFIKEILPNILAENNNIKFYIVGSNPPEDIQKLESENIVVTGYVTDEQLEQYYKQCRIVVVPLRYGAGVKGKVVEALSHFVPIVTTPIGAEGLNGIESSVLIASEKEEFSSKVNQLYNNEQQWIELAKNSKKYIEKHFSLDAALTQIKKDIY